MTDPASCQTALVMDVAAGNARHVPANADAAAAAAAAAADGAAAANPTCA